MELVTTMQKNFERSHGMLIQFIETCPDNIWKQTFGGFPIWQQVFHSFACYDFFIREKGAPETSILFGAGEASLPSQEIAKKNPTKAEILKAAEKGKAIVDVFFATMTDAKLADPHEGASDRMSAPINNLSVLNIICTHGFYHLGSCDAALREAGLEGIF